MGDTWWWKWGYLVAEVGIHGGRSRDTWWQKWRNMVAEVGDTWWQKWGYMVVEVGYKWSNILYMVAEVGFIMYAFRLLMLNAMF